TGTSRGIRLRRGAGPTLSSTSSVRGTMSPHRARRSRTWIRGGSSMADSALSRRQLMAIAAGTGLAAWTAWHGLAAAQSPAGESPKYGGVLTQDIFADPPHFDLHQSETITALLPLAPCYSRLIQPDPLDVDKLIPDLAERWDISKDGKVYTFHLRRGVK